MSYIPVDLEALMNDLRYNVVEIDFDKLNGERRVMRCTLHKRYLPLPQQDIINENRSNPDVMRVWDIEAKGWRTFYTNRVISIQAVNNY